MNVQEQELREKIDPYLTREALTAVVRRALGSSVDVIGSRVLTGGCWNRVLGVETSEVPLVFKIGLKTGSREFARELEVLKYFHDETALPVAAPYFVDLEGEMIPGSLLVESLLPGEVMHHVFGYLSSDSRDRVTDQITDYLTDLHLKKVKGFGGVELPESERTRQWPDFWIPGIDGLIDKVAGGNYLDDHRIDELREVTELFPEILSIGDTGTLTHYDIWSGNVMIDIQSDPPRVTGFIDIPGYFADYAREIAFMHVFGMADERFFSRYTRVHNLDPGFALRVAVYSLRTHLGHITMYPGESYYRDGADSNVRFIRKHAG